MVMAFSSTGDGVNVGRFWYTWHSWHTQNGRTVASSRHAVRTFGLPSQSPKFMAATEADEPATALIKGWSSNRKLQL